MRKGYDVTDGCRSITDEIVGPGTLLVRYLVSGVGSVVPIRYTCYLFINNGIL